MNFKRIIAAIGSAAVLASSLPCAAAADGAYSVTDEFKSLDYTYEASAFACSDTADAKYGDTSRAVKTDVWDSYIVYKFKGLKSFELVTYETSSTKLVSRILDTIVDIYLSEDGSEWVSAEVNTSFSSDEQWRKYVYSCDSIDEDMRYLKIVAKRLGADYNSQHEVQLGKIKFDFASGGRLIPSSGNVEFKQDNGLSAVFGDDFNSYAEKWTVDDAYSELVKNEKEDGDGFVSLESQTEGKSVLAPYITADGPSLNGQFYKISAKIKVENHSGDKCISVLSLKDDEPINSYPISVNREGLLGYRNANYEHVSFEPACYVEPGEWHTVSVVLDTINAREIAYLDGKRVSQTAAELGTPSGGGISQLKIAALEAENISGKFCVSSLEIDDAAGIYSAVGAAPSDSMHWSKAYMDFLRAQGIADLNGIDPESYVTSEEFCSWLAFCSDGKNAVNAGNGEYITRGAAVAAAAELISGDADFGVYENVFGDLLGLDKKTKDGIVRAYGEGIISGQDGKFNSMSFITYAEAAAVVAKVCSPRLRNSVGYNVGIYSDKSFSEYASLLAESLKKRGIYVETLNAEEMQNYDVLNPSVLDCVIMLNSADEEFVSCLRAYLENGGDLVVGGQGLFDSLNTFEFKLPIYNANDDPNYVYDTGALLKTAEGQEDFTEKFELNGLFSGVDAVGYEHRVYSKYIPFLEVKNKYGDHVGYGAGVLVNVGGMYPNSKWLCYGINEPEFYGTEVFRDSAAYMLGEFASGRLDRKYDDTEFIRKNIEAADSFEITEPRPEGYVHLSEDGTQLIDADGNEMFIVGGNVQGLQSMYDFPESGAFGPEQWENIFKDAHDAGLNMIRLWLDYRVLDERYAKMIINYARKYRVYILLETGHTASETLSLERLENFCRTFGDEPMILGVDYWNEPPILSFLLSFGGFEDENPIMDYNLLEWSYIKENQYLFKYFKSAWNGNVNSLVTNGTISENFRDNLVAAEMVMYYGLLEGATNFTMDNVKFRDTAEPWMYEMFQRLFDKGHAKRKAIVEKYMPHAFITIGNLDRHCMLPGVADGQDMWSYHLYNKPNTYEDVIKQLDVFGKLKAIKDMPTVMGEFGLCATDTLSDGSRIREDTSTGYNFLHWAYAFANGYSGATIWTLHERHPANYRYYLRSAKVLTGWTKGATYGERFGILDYDGSPETGYRQKFIAKASKFFETYRLSHKIGEGEISIFPDETQLKAGYDFVGDTAQYVCTRTFESERLSFDMGEDQSPLVLLDWSDGKITLLSSHEMDIVIDPSGYLPAITAGKCTVSGSGDIVSRNGNTVKIHVSAGNKVFISE